MINFIVAMDKNKLIGINNKLPKVAEKPRPFTAGMKGFSYDFL